MAVRQIHSWTLGSLIGAFVDLVLAYFLLCGSAVAFFASKLFIIFGVCVPCPCKGVFGYRNSNLCLHKVLFDWPSRKICSIQVMAWKRLPFQVVWLNDYPCCSNETKTSEKMSENKTLELEDEASCSLASGPRFLSLADRESGYDAKGKRIMNLKRRSGNRRRRRSTYECGKPPPVFPFRNLQSDVALGSSLPCSDSIIGGKIFESKDPALGKEVRVSDVENVQTGNEMEVRTCGSYEFNGSFVDSPRQRRYSSAWEICTSNAPEKVQIIGNDNHRMKMLEQALKEEKAAYVSLYLELEKERAAAATAADEAMAKISRLQEEKAAIQMETRQFHRIIEERFAYDEEEMNILQEILIKRERENHFLEKELEAYRQRNNRGNEKSEGKPKVLLDGQGQRPSFSLESEMHEGPLQIDSSVSAVTKDEISIHSSDDMVSKNGIRTEDRAEEKVGEQKDQIHGNLSDSFLDTELDSHDVHVIDDNMEHRKEQNEKKSAPSFNNDSNEDRDVDLALGSLGGQSSNTMSNFSKISKEESDNGVIGLISQLLVLNTSRCKNLPPYPKWNSSYAENNEKLKIATKIELLGGKLRLMQHEKEKLSFFAENEESKYGQLKLLEDIVNQLQDIKQLRNPVRGASLPPSSDKVSLRKRRCQSATWGTCESA